MFCRVFNVTGQMCDRGPPLAVPVHLERGWPWSRPLERDAPNLF